MAKYLYTGFQASNVGLAIDEINRMVCAGHNFSNPRAALHAPPPFALRS